MVQVLPYVPSPLESLSPYISNAFGQLGEAFAKRGEKKRDETILQSLNDPNSKLTDLQRIAQISKLSADKSKLYSTLYAPMLKEKAKAATYAQEFSNELPELAGQYPGATSNQPEQIQQPSDQQNISPEMGSLPQQMSPGAIQDRQGVAPGMQTQANPGMQGKQSFQSPQPIKQPNLKDISTWTDDQLVRAEGLIGSPWAAKAKAESSRRNRALTQDIANKKIELGYENLGLKQEQFEHSKDKEDKERALGISKELVKTIDESSEGARDKIAPLEVAIKKIGQMKTGPATWDALVSSLAPDHPWFGNFLTKDAQQLESQLPVFLEGFKDQMGGVLTDAKLALLSKKAIGVGKDKYANLLSAYLPYFSERLSLTRRELKDKIVKENHGIPPGDLYSRLEEGLKPYREQIDEDLTRLTEDKMPIGDLYKPSIGKSSKESFKSLNAIKNPKEGMKAMNDKNGQKYQYKNGRWIKLSKEEK